jgi:hypothetical protein
VENGSSEIPLSFAGFCIFEALEVYGQAGALGSVHTGEAGGGLALRPRSGHLRINCARRERNSLKKTTPCVQLGGNGELVPINFAAFRKLIDGAICGVRVVSCDRVWRKEYFTYKFDPPQRPAPSRAGR